MRAGRRVEQQIADPLPRRRPAGLARDEDGDVLLAQVLLEHRDLGALARAFNPFEGDERSGGGWSFEFRHEGEGDGTRQTVPREQPPRVERRDDDQTTGGPQREPRAREIDPLAADVEVPASKRLRDPREHLREQREQGQREEQHHPRQGRERRERAAAVLVDDVLLQQRVAAHPREPAERAEPYGEHDGPRQVRHRGHHDQRAGRREQRRHEDAVALEDAGGGVRARHPERHPDAEGGDHQAPAGLAAVDRRRDEVGTPTASTAPTAPKAITIPPVIAAAIVSSRRNRIPSRVSRQTRDMSSARARPDESWSAR